MDLMTYALCKGNGGGGSSNKFIVTLTPTAQDYSGTMDKTVAEIKTAYDAGQQIRFVMNDGNGTEYTVPCDEVTYNTNDAYPVYCGKVLVPAMDSIVFIHTSYIDGVNDVYFTKIYPLTPLS